MEDKIVKDGYWIAVQSKLDLRKLWALIEKDENLSKVVGVASDLEKFKDLVKEFEDE